jgi:hypothetical protein
VPSRSFRNNNPGNLRHHGPAGVFPVVERLHGTDDGQNYARFPTVADGCAALADLLAIGYNDSTVAQLIAKYAPSNDKNDPEKYTKTVCAWAGTDPKDLIRDLEPMKFFDLCKAITRFEGWEKVN